MSAVLAATIIVRVDCRTSHTSIKELRQVRSGFILFMFSRHGHKYQRDDVPCWCRDANAREDDGGSGKKTATITRTVAIALAKLNMGSTQRGQCYAAATS